MTKLQAALKRSTMLVPILVASTAAPVYAQDAEQVATQNQPGDVIVVTGSRIEKRAEESSIPLQVFGADDLEETGVTDLAEAITQLPGVGDGVSVQNSNNSIQNNGLSTISLRRLGDNRTLVLINGKRAVSNSGNGDRVSLGTIPAGFVKRAEITTGGASAIYGSDAIAGVANFVLEDSFEGVDLDVRYSAPEASGGEELRLEGLFGTRFSDDRGYVLFGASYRDENEILADASRPLSIAAIEFDDPADSSRDSFANELDALGCSRTNTNRHCLLPSFDSDLPGGVFEGDAWFKDGRWFNDKSLRPTLPDGSFDRAENQDFLGDFDGQNQRPGQSLRAQRKVLNLGFHGKYEFSDVFTASLTALYSDVDTLTRNGFEDGGSGETFGISEDGVPDVFSVRRMSSSHPFIPPEVEETRSGSVSWIRSFPEVGEEQRVNSRETIRVMADFDGQITDAISWNAFATYGRWKQRAINNGEINLQNLDFALDIDPDGNGGFQCASEMARANGCVPINLFGEGSVSAAAADYIRYIGDASQERDQFTAGGSINGDLFELGDRSVKFAAGFEYRRETQNTRGDRDGDLVGGVDGDPTTNDVFVTTHSTFPSVNAKYDVIEGFAEIDVPIVQDVNISGAVRVANYSTIGSIFSLNAGLVWQLNDDVRFRTQFSRSQRAPNITEFFSPPRPDSDDLQDPCEGLNPDGSGITAPSSPGGAGVNLATISANCRAVPGIQAFFADPDNAGDSFDTGGSTQGPNAGNGNLQEETANTFTAGVVIQPSAIPNFSFVMDYYRISIKDAIGSISTQNTVDLCYASDDFPNNKFCDVITRSAVDGGVDEVINFQENLNNELVEGIDATLRWRRIELPVIPGRFDIDFRYSHYITDQTTFTGLGGVTILETPLGEIENGKDEFRLRMGYNNGGFRLTYTINYLEGGVDSNDAGRLSDDRYFRVGDQTFHDIYARYRFGDDLRFTLSAGVNNLFDNQGPLVPSGTDTGGSSNITTDLNDAVGREFFVGLGVRF